MAVEAVVGEIELAAHEPFGPGCIPFEDFSPGFEPVEVMRNAAPESFGIAGGFGVEALVIFDAANVGVGGEAGRGREDALFVERGLDVGLGRVGRHGGDHMHDIRRGWRDCVRVVSCKVR